MAAERPDALLVPAYLVLVEERVRIVRFAGENRTPAIYSQEAFVRAGGLMSYGVELGSLYKRAATYVDKIIKGDAPADLPVEQPTTFKLVVNLKTAKALGLNVPPSCVRRTLSSALSPCLRQSRRKLETTSSLSLLREPGFLPATLPSASFGKLLGGVDYHAPSA